MARSSLAICLLLLVTLSAVYEVQGTFLLRHYMRKFPRRSREFRPFACRGMLRFVDVLEHRCPFKPEYKNFFGRLKSYVSFLNLASTSKNYDVELKGQAEGLNSAMSALTGKGGSSVDSTKVIDTLMSMGKTMGENQRSGSLIMRLGQRRELAMSMAKWAQVISQFVSSAAAKSGSSIDISSLGIDGIDEEINSSSSTSETGTSLNKGTGTTNVGSTDTSAGGPTGSTNTGTTTTSCTTGACSSGGGVTPNGGNSFKGSINYQQLSDQKSSDQTVTGSS